MQLYYQKYKCNFVDLHLIANDSELLFCTFSCNKKNLINKENKVLKDVKNQLDLYFSGKLKKFNIKLKLSGTDFQLKVWKNLLKIPYGKTSSYKIEAEKLKTKAYRAVGTANKVNPICIIIPCHRVISSSGKLSGYAGGSDLKFNLLELEKNNLK